MSVSNQYDLFWLAQSISYLMNMNMNMNNLIIVPSADIRQESFSVLSSYLTIFISKYPLRYLRFSYNDCLFCVSILRKHMATNAARIKLPLT